MTQYTPAYLRRARESAGYTRKRLAEQVGKSIYTLADYERGRRRPSADVLAELADALGCPVGTFYQEVPSR